VVCELVPLSYAIPRPDDHVSHDHGVTWSRVVAVVGGGGTHVVMWAETIPDVAAVPVKLSAARSANWLLARRPSKPESLLPRQTR